MLNGESRCLEEKLLVEGLRNHLGRDEVAPQKLPYCDFFESRLAAAAFSFESSRMVW